MVEFALILPIFLLLILGTIQVGIWQLASYNLQHAAIQGATAGAAEPAPARRCDIAITTAERVLGHAPASAACIAIGADFTLELGDRVAQVAPVVENFPQLLKVSAFGRAVVR